MARRRIGLWLIGAKGGVAVSAITGLIALRKELTGPGGLVSELPLFSDLDLATWKDFVVGGHEIRDISLVDAAEQLHTSSGVLSPQILLRCRTDFKRIEQNIRPGTVLNTGSTIEQLATTAVRRKRENPRSVIRRIQTDLRSFRDEHRLSEVIVVNVASTEPPTATDRLPNRWSALNRLLDKPRSPQLPASSLYAIAALDLGLPYINFTPSLGSSLAAIDELARLRETVHMGRDGKTGETLLKSVLAPMFAQRNLEIMSWVGHNIFGNMDSQVLDNPSNKQSKMMSKDQLLGQILGYQPETLVSIEYIKSLGDWKTAWDHIHFRGFLNTPMTMQFTWQGCDSLLAAPLVLDLVRFAHRARQAGTIGSLDFLASFFKSPYGVEENDFFTQFSRLISWAHEVAKC